MAAVVRRAVDARAPRAAIEGKKGCGREEGKGEKRDRSEANLEAARVMLAMLLRE